MTITADRLRVYRAYPRLPPKPGGMERHIASLTAAQRALGVDVVLIHNTGTAEGPAVQIARDFDLSYFKPNAFRDAIFYLAAYLTTTPTKNEKVNVLHVHGDCSAFLAGKLLARRLKVGLLVASFHGSALAKPAHYRWSLDGYKVVFATGLRESRYLSQVLSREVYHLPSAPHDIFFAQYPRTSDCDVIAVGNLLSVKRTELLIACAAARPNLRFSIYGDGPERTAIESLITANGCRNVTLHGNAEPRDVAAALTSARVFLNVSASEGTPTAVLEAMARGLPVVLTPSNDYRWLIKNGVNGFVTAGWDVDEIVSRLDACLADEDRRSTMGAASRAIAEKHRWSLKAGFVTDQIIEALEEQRPI